MVGWLAPHRSGGAGGDPGGQRHDDDFGALPGRPGYETNQEILRRYGDGGAADPLVLTVTLPAGTTVDTPGVRDELAAAVDRAAAHGRRRRGTVSYPGTGDRGLVSADGRTTFALLYPPAGADVPAYAPSVAALDPALAEIRVAGAPLRLTGTDALFVASSDADRPGPAGRDRSSPGSRRWSCSSLVFGSALAAAADRARRSSRSWSRSSRSGA